MFNKPKKLTPLASETMQSIVTKAIEDARDFCDEDIAPLREKADEYYQGFSAVKAEPGRSAVVVTRVRDAVKTVVPSLARIFTQSDTIAQFESDLEEDEKQCQEQTLFVNQVYHKFGGYQALISGCTDALKAKVGVVEVNLERKPVAVHTFEDLVNEDRYKMLLTDPTQVITEETPPMPSPEDDGTMVRGVVLTKQSFRTKWYIDPVPPESFFISRGATSLADARIHGVARNYEIWEAQQLLGLPLEDFEGVDRDEELDDEAEARTGIDPESEEDGDDPHTREVLVTRAWMRIDADGDGVAELRKIVTLGTKYKIVSDEPVNYTNLAVFKAELQPHTFFPICLAEDLEQDQDAQTALLRSIIDNTALVNNPRTAAVETAVNLTDLQNGKIGAIVRTKAPGMIEELVTPFVAGQTLQVLQALEAVSEARSGVTKMSQGLSADVLQSTPKEAANAMVQGSDARIEMMARNIGETGVTELFLTILRVAMNEMQGPQSIRTPTGYEEVRPDMWHDQVAVNCNVGLGNGRVGEKSMALGQLVQLITQVMQQLGLDNPLAGWEQLRKAVIDNLKLMGIRNGADYLPLVPDAMIKQISDGMKQAAAQASQPPQGPDLVGAEKVKGEVQMQVTQAELQQKGAIEQAKLQTQLASDMVKAKLDDDRQRDIAAGQFAVDAQKAELDAMQRAQVAVEQAKPRNYGPGPQ